MMRNHTRSRAASAVIALACALAFLLAVPAAQATTDNPGGGANGCHSYPSKFYKTGDTIIGVITLDCNRYWQNMRIGLVITRSGGGKPAKTFYQSPMRTCANNNVCVATFGIQDVAGNQTYRLTQDPLGTWVSTGRAWSTPKGPTGSGEMTCSGGDYNAILCSSSAYKTW